MDSSPGEELSQAEQRLLQSVLDAIIPPRAELPGAGQLGLADGLERALRKLPDLRSMIRDGLRDLDAEARRSHARGFVDIAPADKVQLLQQQAFVLPLTMQAYVVYYQDPRVLGALGVPARAPHPQGHEMAENDLTLLDEVRRRPPLYRKVSA